MTNPTFLIVPGSFAPPTFYTVLVDALKEGGYPAVVIELPSTRKRSPLPPATMSQDADVTKRAAETLVGLGREVVVVCHSYGGVPTTQALVGVPVKRIVYLTAVVPLVGQSELEALPQPEGFIPESTEGYMHLDHIMFTGALLNDTPWEDAYPIALQLQHHSKASFEEKVTQIAYAPTDDGKLTPVTYVVCTKDLIINLEQQQGLVKRLEEVRGEKVDLRSLESGHCPQWSVLRELVDVLVAVAKLD